MAAFVSTALNTQSRHGNDVYLLLMVIRRPFSRSLLSIKRSEACWPPVHQRVQQRGLAVVHVRDARGFDDVSADGGLG